MSFRDWLKTEMEAKDVSRRELARRLATKHPKGVTPSTVETYRVAVRRYLSGDQIPVVTTREAIADALEVDRAALPTDEDEEEDLQLALLIRACRAKARRKELPWRLEKWLKFGRDNGIFQEYAREEIAA